MLDTVTMGHILSVLLVTDKHMRKVTLRTGDVLKESDRLRFKIKDKKVEVYKQLHPKLPFKYRGYYSDVVKVEMV